MAPAIRLAYIATACALLSAGCIGSLNAQSNALGLRAGISGWSLPLYADSYPEFHSSKRVALDIEAFLRREDRGSWIHEWSIGCTSYEQDVRYLVFDAPDRAQSNVSVLDGTFSLLREIGAHRVEQHRVRTLVGFSFGSSFLLVSNRWAGWDFDGNTSVYQNASWSLAAFAGLSVSNSVAINRNVTASSLFSYKFNPLAFASSWSYPLPPHRFSARLGIGFRI